ncbi:flagellar protein FlgN [Microbacterium sp. SSW1-47]|uniref:flagellar export chaperone FlgN n=1 Tax=Microbacterium sufflavum TaxID=2851649 RepID=UPI001FFCAD32|nr:flagellar export chaperone FlgN [Microbacterium sufflavum]MCK2026553.1 flagellar protein FlgN [Microbacterium sufflavum]
MGANELSMQLWRERELLEMLLFKLDEQQLLLAAGRSHWIQFAAREIDQVLDRLRSAGLARAVEVAGVAQEWGASDEATITELIEHAPEGAWADVLTDHLRALVRLTAEVEQMRDSTAEQLSGVLRATQETIAALGVESGEYTTRGDRAREDSARIIDTEM